MTCKECGAEIRNEVDIGDACPDCEYKIINMTDSLKEYVDKLDKLKALLEEKGEYAEAEKMRDELDALWEKRQKELAVK